MKVATMTVLAAALAVGVGSAWGQERRDAGAGQPAAVPAAEAQGRDQERVPFDVPAREGTRVLVLPFEQIGGTAAGGYEWIGRAVQQNLVTELGRTGPRDRVTVIAPARAGSTPAADTSAAVEAGRKSGADVVVFGSFTLVDQDLRINGQVVDVGTGETVGTLKATGTVRDLFALEDTIATQVKRLVAPESLVPYPADRVATATAPATQQYDQAQQIQQNLMATMPAVQPAVPGTYVTNYNQYTYYPQRSYGYGYGYYGYGWPVYYGNYCRPAWNDGWCGWTAANLSPWVSVHRTHNRPIGVGTNGSLVARGMISVPNYRSMSSGNGGFRSASTSIGRGGMSGRGVSIAGR